MIRISAFIFIALSVMVLPAFAGGADVDIKKEVTKPKADHVIPPTSAGGAEMPPAKPAKVLPPMEQIAITTAPLPPLIRKVTVLIESDPSSSGIEVDGVYIGASPIQVTLKEGVHQMKIAKRGFLPWEHTIKAYNGLYVNAKLVTESTRKGDITESASAQ